MPVSDNDLRLLRDHVADFRMTTYDVLRCLDYSYNAAKKWVGRMKQAGYLSDAQLCGRTKYFHLTPKAAADLQLPESLGKPLSVSRRNDALAMLAFCYLGDRRFRKLTVRDLRKTFPELDQNRLPPDRYYLDEDFSADRFPAKRRLGLILPDVARTTMSIAKRCHELIAQRMRIDPWRTNVIHPGLFIIAVVTPSEGQKGQVEEQLNGRHRHVPIRVEVREQLTKLNLQE